MKSYTAMGLMSGTSLDGIDAAIIETDGHRVSAFGPTASKSYDDDFRADIRAILNARNDIGDVEQRLTEKHAGLVNVLLEKEDINYEKIDIIGFHGQTIDHRPGEGVTRQIGDGAKLAELTGIDVVNEFRLADVAGGGEGAPFAPLYHAALAGLLEKPVAVVNVGGVANVTWIGEDSNNIIAFDTGPGNALLDDWMSGRAGRRCDLDGKTAALGETNTEILEVLTRHPYYARPAPKSLDRNDFSAQVLAAVENLTLEEGAATLTALTAQTIAGSVAHMPAPPKRWLVCGGGRHNPTLMAMLAERVGAPVRPVESVGWRGDSLEAEAFAFLAVRSLLGLPLSLPTTTGVAKPMPGGRLHRSSK